MNKHSVIEEEEIVRAMMQSPESAVELILHKYGDVLYGSILRLTSDAKLAEDILQDALVKIWSKSSSYERSKGKVFSWCWSIVRNTAIDTLRSSKTRLSKSVAYDKSVHENKVSNEPEIKDVGLHKVLSALEEKYRLVIDLLYLKGYTQKEVSEELDIPLGTVKSRVKIGLRELNRLLATVLMFFVKIWM